MSRPPNPSCKYQWIPLQRGTTDTRADVSRIRLLGSILANEPWLAVVSVSRAGLIIADFVLIILTWVTLAVGPARPHLHLGDHSRRSLAAIMLWIGQSIVRLFPGDVLTVGGTLGLIYFW